jgi:hypothetical protein
MRMLRSASLAVLTFLFVSDGDRHLVGAACGTVIACADRTGGEARDLAGADCATLARMRGAIHAEHGYCLKTSAWRATFSGPTCRYTKLAAVPLSGDASARVAAIRRAERARGCGGA